MRRMRPGVVYQTIDLAVSFNSLVDQIADLVRIRDIAFNEMSVTF